MVDNLTSEDLKRLRRIYGLTQRDLGKALGKSRGAVQIWECEKDPPKWLKTWFLGYSCQMAHEARNQK